MCIRQGLCQSPHFFFGGLSLLALNAGMIGTNVLHVHRSSKAMETEGRQPGTTFENNAESCEVEQLVVANGASDEPVKREFNSLNTSELEAVLSDPNTTMSKRYRKRVLRRIEWLKRRPERKALEKEKKKRKREEFKSANGDLVVHRPKFTKMDESLCKIRVAIDLSLDSHMTDKEKGKCRKQIQRCYSLNRRSPAPVQFYLTGMAGSFKDSSSNMHGFERWDVHASDEDHISCFGKENVVYLSSESENELHELEESKAYIIGGLVDHNHSKGLCHRLAEEQGVEHARLPIGNCLIMKTRQVLTIDQVFAILLNKTQGMSWTDALLAAIPRRKGAKALDQESASSSHSSDNDEQQDLRKLLANEIRQLR
ncbi:tRNA methyltransferase 10 homolog A-like isoform X1 [Dermacentor albipictus]|uniref:tRNA methyltransferase 10 homolog A-like isoform X1 n=1 Tax=Dermacentor albipictus TaxID=60249 RepID=UPI0038FC2F98